MIHQLKLCSLDRVDVGIGASKQIKITYTYEWLEGYDARSEVILSDHPKPQVVRFHVLDKDTMRVVNHSSHVVSLWPGRPFLTVKAGHKVYEAFGAAINPTVYAPAIRSATITGRITDVRKETDISVLNLSAVVIHKLRYSGYLTVEQLDKTHSEELLSIAGIGESTVEKIREAVITYMDGEEEDD